MPSALKEIKDVDLAKEIAHVLSEFKGKDIRLLDLSEISSFADYFIIVSGDSHVHLRALCKKVQAAMLDYGYKLKHAEGMDSKTWVLMDYDSIIVHLFSPSARDYYGIEHLWGDAIEISLDGIIPPVPMK